MKIWMMPSYILFFKTSLRISESILETTIILYLGPFIACCSVWAKAPCWRSTFNYNGLLLQIVTWMQCCVIGTHTISSYIYFTSVFYTYLNCSRLETILLCVNITPLGSPVVPLEYGRTTTSSIGSILMFSGKAFPSSSNKVENGWWPSAVPNTTMFYKIKKNEYTKINWKI